MIKKCIIVRKGKWEAAILPDFGANLISLKYRNLPILRTPQSIEQLKETPELYGNPLLFPPNRTKDGIFCFEGKEYKLPVNEEIYRNHLHGCLHKAPFAVKSKTREKAVFCLNNHGEYFPFPFSIEVTFSLEETGLTQSISIQNTGEGNMPVLLGFHTDFLPPDLFSVPIGERWERNCRFIPTGALSGLNEDERSYKNGTCSIGKVISGYYTSNGGKARIGKILYEASPGFTQWILFNRKGSDEILCIEPQSGCVNGLNMPGEHIVLPSGETARFWLRFTAVSE